MSATPLLAGLFGRAFPGLAARDLGLPAGHLLPWLPGVRAGLGGSVAPAEAALLARFRQGGRPLLGLDPLADARPDAAWEAAPERLVWQQAPGPAPDATLTLLHGGLGEAAVPAGQARIMLLAGDVAAVERHDLLVAEDRLVDIFERLRAAASGLAGPAWQVGGRLVSARLASLGVLAPTGGHAPVLSLAAESLPCDLPDAADLGGTARLRLLLGALPAGPWRLRLGFAGVEPGPVALFLDGRHQPARLEGDAWLAASIMPKPGRALVLGLAWPGAGAPAGLRLGVLEARR